LKQVTCPNCKVTLDVKNHYASAVRCAECGTEFEVEAASCIGSLLGCGLILIAVAVMLTGLLTLFLPPFGWAWSLAAGYIGSQLVKAANKTMPE